MLGVADRAVAVVLVVVHAGLLAWALTGFAEMVLATPPWQPISNPLFSTAMLLLQWSVVAAAALTFLVGYARRWPLLPAAMAAWYAVMAAICAWQTFFVLEHALRFVQMALEYAEYIAITIYLRASPYFQGRLKPFSSVPEQAFEAREVIVNDRAVRTSANESF
jgi:hypothetical protein